MRLLSRIPVSPAMMPEPKPLLMLCTADDDGNAEIGRVVVSGGSELGRRCLPHVDTGCEPLGVVGGEQYTERCCNRIRVGRPTLAVGEGELLRLDHDMDRVSR